MIQIDKEKIYFVNGYSFTSYTRLDNDILLKICEWRNDPIERKYSYNKEAISFKQHLSFVQGLKTREDASYWLVGKGTSLIGVSNLTSINKRDGRAELGYGLNPELRNKGIGVDFALTNFLFAFDIIGCDNLFGGIIKSNYNAIVLDSFFGCTIEREDIINIDIVDYLRWTLSKNDFKKNSSEGKDFRGLVKYMKDNKEYLDLFKQYAQ